MWLRIALIIAVLWFAMMLVSRIRGSRGEAPPPNKVPDRLVECRICGVRLPAAEAISNGQGEYRCREHEL